MPYAHNQTHCDYFPFPLPCRCKITTNLFDSDESSSSTVHSLGWPPSTSFIFRLKKLTSTNALLLKIAIVGDVVDAAAAVDARRCAAVAMCTGFSTFIRIWHLTFGISMLCVPSTSRWLACSLFYMLVLLVSLDVCCRFFLGRRYIEHFPGRNFADNIQIFFLFIRIF